MIDTEILADNLSWIGTMALLATLLRYWCLLLPVLYIAVYCLISRWKPKHRKIMFDNNIKGKVSVGLLEMSEKEIFINLVNQLILMIFNLLLTALTIAANVHPSLKMSGLLWKVIIKYISLESRSYPQEHRLSDLAIVEKIYLLNYIFALTLVAYFLRVIIYYVKIWRPFQEAKALKDMEDFLEKKNYSNILVW